MSAGQKTSHSKVAGPLICSPSPSWLVLMTKSSVDVPWCVVDVVAVVKVDVQTRVTDGVLESKWLTKVW